MLLQPADDPHTAIHVSGSAHATSSGGRVKVKTVSDMRELWGIRIKAVYDERGEAVYPLFHHQTST